MITTRELRELHGPIKDRFRDDPQAAQITLKADGSLDDGISCSVETGRALGISAHTVRRHLSNMASKVGVRGRVALTRYAMEHDLVQDEG